MTVGAADSSLIRFERSTARFGARFTTTPGRMRLAGAAIVVGLLALAIVGLASVSSRQRASNAVGSEAEPLLVQSETLYSSLADADATATNSFTNSFLQAGLEDSTRRQQYLTDLGNAAAALTMVSGSAGNSSEVTGAEGMINKQLPIYSGLVEAARADNRQGFPVGAAYLSEASALMQNQILPAAGQLYQVESQRLNGAYDSGRSWLDIAGVLAVALMALVLLAVTQAFLTRRTNRVLNLAMLIASAVTVVLVAWTVLAFTLSASRLSQARSQGSDPVQLLSSAQILLSRTQVDENLALVARGSNPQYLADFDAAAATLGGTDGRSGLIAKAATYPGVDGDALAAKFTAYVTAHKAVAAAANGGSYTKAVSLATGSGTGAELPAAQALARALSDDVSGSQARFATRASDAAHDLSLLRLVAVGLVIAAGAALAGLEQRINEYR